MSPGTGPSVFKSWSQYQLCELGKLLKLPPPLRGLSLLIYKMRIVKQINTYRALSSDKVLKKMLGIIVIVSPRHDVTM